MGVGAEGVGNLALLGGTLRVGGEAQSCSVGLPVSTLRDVPVEISAKECAKSLIPLDLVWGLGALR